MLYHYASLDYLKVLHRLVTQLIDGVVDPLLDLAKNQNRDSVLVDPQWGTRDTSENWSNNAWPFLTDFQLSLAKDIAGRAVERYEITGANQCLRGIAEYSTQWATPDEEDRLEKALVAIGRYAARIDYTMDDYHNSRWSDFGFTLYFPEYAKQFPRLPKFRIRTDVQGESGKVPPRTGVYVSQEDPNAALQFAWTGDGGGKLRPSSTFNQVGLDALSAVGRRDLWSNENAMFAFATSKKYLSTFEKDVFFKNEPDPSMAPSAVARKAFIDRPCKWYFVEILNGEFEEIDTDAEIVPSAQSSNRIEAGNPCPEAGYYFSPAKVNSRRLFAQGETMPGFDSAYGQTIWQWDANQD